MKLIIHLSILSLLLVSSYSSFAQVHENRIIDTVDKIFGLLYDARSNTNLCSFSLANLDEYKQVRCGIKIDGMYGYMYEGDESWTDGTFSAGWMQDFTDNIVFQSATLDVFRFNKCQKSYFTKMSTGSPRLENLKTASFGMFEQVRAVIKVQDLGISERMAIMESEVSVAVMSTAPTSDYRILNALERSAEVTEPKREVISQLASTIPLGNRPQMRDFIVKAARDNYDSNQFKRGYEATVRVLDTEARGNYNLIASKIVDNSKPEQPIFEVDNSLKKSLFKNGVIDNILVESNLESFNNSNYMCRYRSQLRGQEVRLWAELALAAAMMPATGGFSGYTVTSLRFASILQKSSKIKSAVNMGKRAMVAVRNTKAGRLALTGSWGTVDFGLTALEAKRECFTPDYVASKSVGVCNAETQYDIVIEEASATTCMLGLGVSALTGIALTRSIKKAAAAVP